MCEGACSGGRNFCVSPSSIASMQIPSNKMTICFISLVIRFMFITTEAKPLVPSFFYSSPIQNVSFLIWSLCKPMILFNPFVLSMLYLKLDLLAVIASAELESFKQLMKISTCCSWYIVPAQAAWWLDCLHTFSFSKLSFSDLVSMEWGPKYRL